MKANDLLDMIGNADDGIVEEAKKRKKPVVARWTRWVAVAACLALVVAVGIPYISDVIGRKAGPGQNDPFRPLGAVEFNGAYYEIVETSNTDKLDEYNLPHEITADMIGERLGSGLNSDGKQTKVLFYQYTPYAEVSTMEANGGKRAQRAVFVVSDDSEYSLRYSVDLSAMARVQTLKQKKCLLFMVLIAQKILALLRRIMIHLMHSKRLLRGYTAPFQIAMRNTKMKLMAP